MGLIIETSFGGSVSNSSIRDLKEKVENLNSQVQENTDIVNNLKEELYKMFEIPTDDSDCYSSLQSFIDYCAEEKIHTVQLPQNTTLHISHYLNVPAGLNIEGNNATIVRTFNKTHFGTIRLNGNNIVSGLLVNGNKETINDKNNFTQYADFWVTGDNVIIENNKIFDSCGSGVVIQGSSFCTIRNNTFNNYLDHAIYLSTPSEAFIEGNKNITIENNYIEDNTNNREAIKLRNNISNVNILNNFVVTPNGYFATIDSGNINMSISRNINNVNIINNTVYSKSFINSIPQNNTCVQNLTIQGNYIEVTIYFIGLKYPTADNQFALDIEHIKIDNNIIKKIGTNSEPLFCLNGNIEHIGIEMFELINNSITYSNQSRLFYIFGKVQNIHIIGNTINNLYETSSNVYSHPIILFSRNSTPSEQYVHDNRNLIFKNNILAKKNTGVLSPLLSDTTNNELESHIKYNIVVSDNIIDTNGIFKICSSSASNITTTDKKMIVKNNISFNDISIGHWNIENITQDF